MAEPTFARRWIAALLALVLVAPGWGDQVCYKDGTCGVEDKWDAVVTIYSYDRPRYLLLLLEDIEREAKQAGLAVHVHVVDDNSIDCIYPPQTDNVYDSKERLYDNDLTEFPLASTGGGVVCQSLPRFSTVLDFLQARQWRFFSSRYRHGKRRYWHQVAQAHSLLKGVGAKYYFFLPDDDRLCGDFFSKAIKAWDAIQDQNKITLMLHIEASRVGGNGWTQQMPKKEGHVIRIGWVESGNFMCQKRFLETVKYSFPRVATTRWDGRPTLSSGVGYTLTELLWKKKLSMFRTPGSLLAHVGNRESKMNFDLRQTEQLRTLQFEDGEKRLEELMAEPPSVHAGLASKWSRLRSLHSAVNSLAPQVDRIHVYLNAYEFVPAFLRGVPWIEVIRSEDANGDIGDAGKFFRAGQLDIDYMVTADDDIVYPPDYVRRLIAFRNDIEGPAVVGLHGIILLEHRLKPLQGPGRGYYASREVFMGVGTVDAHRDVNILGTGLALYRPKDLPALTVKDFKEPNMADVWLGIEAKKLGIPMVVMAHQEGWITTVDGTFDDSLYVSYTKKHRADQKLTAAVLSEMPWKILPSKRR